MLVCCAPHCDRESLPGMGYCSAHLPSTFPPVPPDELEHNRREALRASGKMIGGIDTADDLRHHVADVAKMNSDAMRAMNGPTVGPALLSPGEPLAAARATAAAVKPGIYAAAKDGMVYIMVQGEDPAVSPFMVALLPGHAEEHARAVRRAAAEATIQGHGRKA